MILASRREYIHWTNYRVYVGEWIKTARTNKDLKDRVVIVNELNTQIRHVWLNVPHSANPKTRGRGLLARRFEKGGDLHR